MDDVAIAINISNLLPEAHASSIAEDQSTASPGGSVRRASWGRHSVSGNAKNIVPRPIPPQLRS